MLLHLFIVFEWTHYIAASVDFVEELLQNLHLRLAHAAQAIPHLVALEFVSLCDNVNRCGSHLLGWMVQILDCQLHHLIVRNPFIIDFVFLDQIVD